MENKIVIRVLVTLAILAGLISLRIFCSFSLANMVLEGLIAIILLAEGPQVMWVTFLISTKLVAKARGLFKRQEQERVFKSILRPSRYDE